MLRRSKKVFRPVDKPYWTFEIYRTFDSFHSSDARRLTMANRRQSAPHGQRHHYGPHHGYHLVFSIVPLPFRQLTATIVSSSAKAKKWKMNKAAKLFGTG